VGDDHDHCGARGVAYDARQPLARVAIEPGVGLVEHE